MQTIEVFTNRLLRTLFCFKIQDLWKTATLSLTMKGSLNVIRRFWRCLCSILQKSGKNISDIRITDHTWTVSSEVTDRSSLSNELANFCAKYPIYNVKKMEDTLKTARIQTGGERHIKTLKYSTTPSLSQRLCQRWPRVFNKIKNTIVGVIVLICLSLIVSEHALRKLPVAMLRGWISPLYRSRP